MSQCFGRGFSGGRVGGGVEWGGLVWSSNQHREQIHTRWLFFFPLEMGVWGWGSARCSCLENIWRVTEYEQENEPSVADYLWAKAKARQGPWSRGRRNLVHGNRNDQKWTKNFQSHAFVMCTDGFKHRLQMLLQCFSWHLWSKTVSPPLYSNTSITPQAVQKLSHSAKLFKI